MADESRSKTNLKLLNALTWNQKISLVVLSVAVIAGISSMVYFMNQDEYQTLYSDLGAEEANIVIEKLKADAVPYRIADAGKAIQVPVERLDELRLQLASQGLPQGGKIGFEIFDQSNLGMTEFLERVSYKRALEGELARTILSLKEIGEVRVHLVLPKESLFEAQSEPTKASVVLKLKSAKQLNESVVSGIVHLVSSAVEGLTPGNVTVVDSNGRLLSDSPGSPEEALTGNQAELKSRTEKDLTARVVSLLEPVVGQGKVRADASVLLDFSRSEQTEEKYDPMVAIRSQQKSEEHTDPLVPATAGVPGTQANGANPPVFIPTGKTANSFLQQSETTNYEVSKVVRHTLEPVGEISRLSVAIIVDDAIRNDAAPDGSTVRTVVPRTPEDLKKIRDLVSAAIGIDAQRGDLLTIENIAFDVAPIFEEVPATLFQEWGSLFRPALRYGALLLLFLMVALLLVRPVTKRLLTPIQANEVDDGDQLEGTTVRSIAAPQTVKELQAALEELSQSTAGPAHDGRRADVLKQKIAEFVQREPEKGAKLLRAWLTEEGK